MKVNDILGLGKVLPVDKLIEVVSQITGRLTKQYFDKKDIDTKAYEIRKLAEARASEMKIITDAVKENFSGTGGIEYKEEKLQITSSRDIQKPEIPLLPSDDLENRTKDRVLLQQAKKQLNIESITSVAAEQLKEEPAIENTALNEDWMNRFFNIAEDISNEEMQMLWGKILAGEIKRPKSYSIRTLEVVRNLSKDEADVVSKVANFAFSFNNNYGLFKGADKVLEKFGVTFYDTALLTELGILQPGDFIGFDLTANNPVPTQNLFLFGPTGVFVNRITNASQQNIPIYLFSKVGIEILKLINIHPSFEYVKEFAKYLKREDTKVQYASILKVDNEVINHTLPLQEFD